MIRVARLAVLAVLALFPVSLACAAQALAAPLQVMVSIEPQRYFLNKLAGPLAQVSVLVPPGADAHTFEPKPGQMAQVAKARLYIAQGVEFEQVWLPRLAKSNPGLVVVDTIKGLDLLPMEEDHDHDHDKGHDKGHGGKAGHAHDEKAMDVHTWTSPRMVKAQCAVIAQALAQADPANAQAYAANLQAFQAELDALDAAIAKALEGVPKGSRFLVFHPAWAYFARDYGLRELAIEVGGREPGPRQLKKIIEQAREARLRVILVQPQFSRKAAQTVADAVGARLVDADVMAADWAGNLLAVAKAFTEAAR